jgi:hypothetical protein
MLRTIFELPSIVADYTVGTLIVLVQLAITAAIRWRSRIRPAPIFAIRAVHPLARPSSPILGSRDFVASARTR